MLVRELLEIVGSLQLLLVPWAAESELFNCTMEQLCDSFSA
jgi:hypothetical protein